METQNDPMVEKVSTRSAGMRYGLFMAAIGIASFLVTTLSGINITDGAAAWVNRIFSFTYIAVILFLAQQYFKKNGDGFMSYGQGFGVGFWASLISSLISGVFVYIYVKFVDASFMDMIKDKQIESMQARGMSEEQIDQAMKFAAMFSTPEAILIFSVIGGLVIGLLVALIVTIFTQYKNPEAATLD